MTERLSEHIPFAYSRSRIENVGFRYYSGSLLFKLANPVMRRYLYPSLRDYQESGFQCYYDSLNLLSDILSLPGQALEKYAREFQDLLSELNKRKTMNVQTHSESYGVELQTAKLLYLMVRITRKKKIFETGVANGISTYFLINALMKNGNGKLFSTDVSPDVAPNLIDKEKEYWELFVLKGRAKSQLENFIRKNGPFDIFIHDSDHSYPWQSLEYRLGMDSLEEGGYLLSDDIDSSFAFIDKFRNLTNRVSVLIQTSKILGIVGP